jgi:hypothetical protein
MSCLLQKVYETCAYTPPSRCILPTLMQVLHIFTTMFKSVKDYYKLYSLPTLLCGPGSSAGIATDYWLDGPGIESQWDEIFRPSRPALGSIQPPVQWVPGLSRG